MFQTVGIIGTGAMGSAIAALAADDPNVTLLLSNRTEEKARALAATLRAHVSTNTEIAQRCDLIVLAVKPQIMPDVLREVAPVLAARQSRFVLVTPAAGLTIASIRALAGAPLPSMPGYEEAVAALKPIEFHYSLPDRYSPGPVPDSSCYGETTDPRAVAELLKTDMAQRLIDGQALDFDPERDMLGRPIYYYLDETILALVWQQDEHGAVGTFAEVFLADASQLRRKLAGDTFGSFDYAYASQLSAQANAVVACSGDFYNSGRPTYGLCVYDGQLLRSCLTDGQTCFFTDEGDMLFAYENDFSSEQEAQHWLDEHRVMFSLAFGPVMVDNGRDVTPYSYALGEVLDTYARCAIGQLGKLHYLSMTINCESPDHYVYVTLRQAADSMIAHGCVNAYTLDGGQTGSILIGGQLINPVQFGVERLVSDIFYFATAIPDT